MKLAMSALRHRQTFRQIWPRSALPPKIG